MRVYVETNFALHDPTCFLNRNTRDFDSFAVSELLGAKPCKLLGSFKDGLSYIKATRKSDTACRSVASAPGTRRTI